MSYLNKPDYGTRKKRKDISLKLFLAGLGVVVTFLAMFAWAVN